MEFRAFLKPSGTNAEIEGLFYELSSFACIVGHFNFESITLGFEKGSSMSDMLFRPIDPTKPIVLAIDDMTGIGFVLIDGHLGKKVRAGMHNHSALKTNKFVIDCQRGDISKSGGNYWSITSEGMTFVYGGATFPETWHLADCDHLCAFIGGEVTANQLRMHAYLTHREAVKEERREAHIKHMSHELRKVTINNSDSQLSLLRLISRHMRMIDELKLTMMNGVLPFISKANILKIIKENG